MNISRINKSFRQVFLGDRSAEEVKGEGKIISKKLYVVRAGSLCKTRNSFQRNIQYYNIHHIDFKSTSRKGFLERPKFKGCNFCFDTNPGRASLDVTFTFVCL